MEHSLERFLRHIQFEKRFSTHTLIAYREDVRQFAYYLNQQFEITTLSDLNHTFIRSWVVSLMETGISTRSVNRKISSLRSFFRFLLREKLITSNPMQKVVAPKNAKKLPVFVEKHNMELLFNHVMADINFSGIRDRLILELFYATGIRLSELIGLKTADVNLYESTIKVLGKRNKERVIPFSGKMLEPFKNYVRERTLFMNEKEKTNDYFFLSDKGNKLAPKIVYLIVKKNLSAVTTIDKRSPHVLRHTFATHMLNNGADINAIKEILGHSSLAATQVYTHNSIEKLKEAHKLAHPRA